MNRRGFQERTCLGALVLMTLASLCLLGRAAETADSKTAGKAGALRVRVGGEIGKAMAKCTARFRSAPFDSLPWLRADLTGETVSGYDSVFGHVMRRPYKEYSGDISGRFIEIMALTSRGDLGIHPVLAELLATVPRQQRPGGYFCASGVIDWQKPFDSAEDGGPVGKPYVIGYGPKIMAAEGRTGAAPGWPTTLEALKASGFEPFATTMRGKDCRFVVSPPAPLKGGGRKATRGKATGNSIGKPPIP